MFGSRVTDQDILTGQLRAMKHAIEALENARDILELADSPWVLVKAEAAIAAAHKAKDRLQLRCPMACAASCTSLDSITDRLPSPGRLSKSHVVAYPPNTFRLC